MTLQTVRIRDYRAHGLVEIGLHGRHTVLLGDPGGAGRRILRALGIGLAIYADPARTTPSKGRTKGLVDQPAFRSRDRCGDGTPPAVEIRTAAGSSWERWLDDATGQTETSITRMEEEDHRVAVVRAGADACPHLPGIAQPASPDLIGAAVAEQMRRRYPTSARPLEGDAVVLIDRADGDWTPADCQRLIPALAGRFPRAQLIIASGREETADPVRTGIVRLNGEEP